MTKGLCLMALLLGLALTGCGSGSDEPNPDKAPVDIVPQYQLDTLEKAKGVDQLVKDADQKRRDALE